MVGIANRFSHELTSGVLRHLRWERIGDGLAEGSAAKMVGTAAKNLHQISAKINVVLWANKHDATKEHATRSLEQASLTDSTHANEEEFSHSGSKNASCHGTLRCYSYCCSKHLHHLFFVLFRPDSLCPLLLY